MEPVFTIPSGLLGRAANPIGFVTRPHIHVMIPGGCLSEDKTQWCPSHPSFFLPVKRLSQDYKEKLIRSLHKAGKKEMLYLPNAYEDFRILLDMIEHKEWVVHSQAAVEKHNDPRGLVRYLARYVAKSAISDKRIQRVGANKVGISYYNRKKKQKKLEVITEEECMRRLVCHVLPKGFKKVRGYGFFANRHKSNMLSLCRMLLGVPLGEQEETDKELLKDTAFLFWMYFQIDITLCSDCKEGHIVYVRGATPGG